MKSLNSLEIQSLCDRLLSLKGARLSAVYVRDPVIVLELQYSGSKNFIIIDLWSAIPSMHLSSEVDFLKNCKMHKPLTLFIKAHFLGKKLSMVEFVKEFGRVIVLYFGKDESLQLEIRLFPHGQNVLARTPEKQVSWNKPQDLKTLPKTNLNQPFLVRASDELFTEWKEKRWRKVLGKDVASPTNDLLKEKSKLEKAINKLEQSQDLFAKDLGSLQDLIKKMESGISISKSDVHSLYDPDKPLTENLDEAYGQLKKLKRKLEGQKNRYIELKSKWNSLQENALTVKIKKSKEVKPVVRSTLGKSWTLASGLKVQVGKNAKENTELLRKAKPWDYWIHLKDYPGSYGLLARNRGQKVDLQDLQKACQWVMKMSFKNKAAERDGSDYDLVYTECRYLQLIKGDKLGRVTYKNAKTLRLRFSVNAAQNAAST